MTQQDEGRIEPPEKEQAQRAGIALLCLRLSELGVPDSALEPILSRGVSAIDAERDRLRAERLGLIADGVPEECLISIDEDQIESVMSGGRSSMVEAIDNNADEIKKLIGEDSGPTISDCAARMPGDGGASMGARECRDIGKLRYDLIPSDFLEFLARIFTYGAAKYDDNNWMKGLKASETYACAMRHMQKWWAGEDNDLDNGEQKGSGLPHLWHALWNVGVMAYFERHRPDLDDRGSVTPRTVTRILPDLEGEYTHSPVVFSVEVQLPADDTTEGFIFAKQGDNRATIEQAKAVLQALRDDGYHSRVTRIVRHAPRVFIFSDGDHEVDGVQSDVVLAVFPGDPALAG